MKMHVLLRLKVFFDSIELHTVSSLTIDLSWTGDVPQKTYKKENKILII